MFRSVHLIVVFTLQNLGKGHKRIPCNKNDASSESRWVLTKFCTSSVNWSKLRSICLLKQGKCLHPLHKCPKKKNCGWFWSFNARAEKRRFELRCKGHHDGQWRSANIRRSTKIRDFGLFVTVQLLDEKSAVQSLGKLCEYHGCFLWVGQRAKATIDNKQEKITHRIPNNDTLVVLGLAVHHPNCRWEINYWQICWNSNMSWELPEMGLAINPQKNLKPKNEKFKSDVDVFLSGWSESQKISRIQKLLHPHKFLKTQIRDGLQKWQKNQEAHFFTCFQMPRLRRLLKNQKKGSFAEGELVKLNDEKKVWWFD